jgi:hypothetical protein
MLLIEMKVTEVKAIDAADPDAPDHCTMVS